MIAFRRKIPSRDAVLALYAVIVFLIYSWAGLAFAWKVPSWLYFLSLGEIAAVFAYTLVSSLLESTIILSVFLGLALVLPSRLFADKFVVRGSIIIIILTFWVAMFNLVTLIQLPTTNDLVSFGTVALLTIALGLVIAERISVLQKILVALGNRLTVFLYFWLPLSALGMLVILFRLI